MKIRFQSPQLPPLSEVADYFQAAEADRWFSNSGPCYRLLVDRLQQTVGSDLRCVPVANATIGLMAALHALTSDRRDGADVVLLPSFTFVATVDAILWCGLTPVFVDVSPTSWHLDPEALGAALTTLGPRVAAVMACSTFGTAPPPEVRRSWEQRCATSNASLLVDSAAGFGSLDESGRPLGGQGDAEVFSFHATKPFAIGEGGAVFTADETLQERIRSLVNFGFDADHDISDQMGLNGKLSEIHCATALAVLDRFPSILARRRASAAAMRAQLEPLGFAFQPGAEHSTHQFVSTLAPDARVRAAVLDEADRRGIEVRTYFSPALHQTRAFGPFERASDLAVTDNLSSRMLSLPMANDLADDDAAQIVACLTDCAR